MVVFQTYRPLLDALVKRGASEDDVQEAASEAERTGRSIRDVLINDSVVTEMELTEAYAEASGIGAVDLVDYPVDPAAVAKIPLPLILRHRVLGIDLDGAELIVATSDPDDVLALDDIRAATGMQLRPVVVARSELRRMIERVKRSENTLGDLNATTVDAAEVANLTSGGEDAPIVRYVNSLLEQAAS